MGPSGLTYRRGTVGDLEPLFQLLCRMRDENWPEVAPNFAKGRRLIAKVLDGGFVVVCEDEGQIVGSIGLTIQSWWWSDAKYIGEYWFYVLPERRNWLLLQGMMRIAKDISNSMGLPLVVGIFTTVDPGRKSEIFKRSLTSAGETFIHYPVEGTANGQLIWW